MDFRTSLIAQGIDVETVDTFLSYHRARPTIWKEFEKKALQLIDLGERQWGAKAIMEVIRFETKIERKGDFKICNSFTAYYARVFMIKYPQHKGFFELRRAEGLEKQSREAA